MRRPGRFEPGTPESNWKTAPATIGAVVTAPYETASTLKGVGPSEKTANSKSFGKAYKKTGGRRERAGRFSGESL
jgi:hypothetical protein